MDLGSAWLGDVWTLLFTSAALMGSPGPSTISVTAVGAAFGVRRSIGYAAGLILGTCFVLLIVATGVLAVLLSIPSLTPVLTAVSAVYIVHLAIRIARAPPLERCEPTASAPSVTGGVLLAAANPKAYVAIGAVFAASRLAGLSAFAEALVKTAILALMIVLIHVGWLIAGVSLSRRLRDPVASRIVNVSLALVLLATSALAIMPR